MSDDQDVRRVLREAADLIERRGLARGVFEDINGHVCTLGAFRLVVTGVVPMFPDTPFEHRTLIRAAEDLLNEHITAPDVSWWSDASPQDEVVRTLREVGRDDD